MWTLSILVRSLLYSSFMIISFPFSVYVFFKNSPNSPQFSKLVWTVPILDTLITFVKTDVNRCRRFSCHLLEKLWWHLHWTLKWNLLPLSGVIMLKTLPAETCSVIMAVLLCARRTSVPKLVHRFVMDWASTHRCAIRRLSWRLNAVVWPAFIYLLFYFCSLLISPAWYRNASVLVCLEFCRYFLVCLLPDWKYVLARLLLFRPWTNVLCGCRLEL